MGSYKKYFFIKTQAACTLCILLVLFSVKTLLANNTDSLTSALKKHLQNDTIRVGLLIRISNIYVSSNVDSAIIFASEGLSVSRSIAYKKGETLCLEALGTAYLHKDDYDKALSFYNEALKIMQGESNDAGISLIYCYIGNVYAHQTRHGEAIEYYKKSLILSRETNDQETEGLALESMGSLYYDLGNLTEGLKYYLQALTTFEAQRDTEAVSSCLSNITGVYSSLGDYKKSLDYNERSQQIFLKTGNKLGVLSTLSNAGLAYGEMNELRTAIAMFNKAIKLSDSIGDKYWKGNSLGNIGEAYYKLGSYDTAYSQYLLALHDAENLGDQSNIAQAKNGIGLILVKKGKIAEGIKSFQTALNIMQQAGRKAPAQEIAMNLSSAYEQAHDFNAALKYYKLSSSYKDSLYDEQNNKHIQQLQFDYELGKKENQISLLQKDVLITKGISDRQSVIIWAILAGLVLLIVISILLYRSRAYEKKSRQEIFVQKEEIQLQASKLEELNEFKDKTFSVLSHDLRGPIDSFSSIISMLDEDVITAEEYMKLKPEMSARIASLTILLDNLLKWASGYMKGQITLKSENTNLYVIARQNISLLQNAAARKQITIINEIPESIMAYCDPGKMDIVIRNLIINAIKFTAHKGNITLEAHEEGDNTFLSIADTGVGMTKEQLNKLFMIAPDNHTYGTDGETGTGLGLLLCYEFVKSNGGTISVVSEKNIGTKFTITLKRTQS